MGSVTGLTAEKMLEIEAASVVGGLINADGELELYTRGSDVINAGVVRGEPGKGIQQTVVAYQAGVSETDAPTGDWLPSIPPIPDGQYLWTRTILVYTDSTRSTSYSIGKMGEKGNQGTPGIPGNNGQPTYLHVAYASNATGSEGFSTSDATNKSHLGTYTDFSPEDSQNPNMYKWVLIKGLDGVQGPQGIPGPAGIDGTSRYTWIKYADSPTTGMSDLPSGKTYMGIAYNKTTATESSVYSDYEWSLIRGVDGTQGIQGPPGANGQPTYTWVKYGTSVTGAGLSDDPTGRPYIGLAYNKLTQTESTVASDYQWALIKGADGNGINSSVVTYQAGTSGTAAPTGTWTSTVPVVSPGQFLWTRTVISFTDGASTTSYSVGRQGVNGVDGAAGPQGIPGPAGADGTPRYTWIKYADSPTVGMSDSPTGKSYMGIAYNKTTPTESAVYTDYEWSLIRGADGIQGPAGANGQPTYTWIKYGTSAAGAGMADSPVGKDYIGIAYNKTTATESSVATDYEWSLIRGPVGNNGVGISTATNYYRTVTKGAAAPAKPTTLTPAAPWATTEPAYVTNTELYGVIRIVYTDGTFTYSDVSKIAAYTAAADAVAQAIAAKATADGKNKIVSSPTAPTSTEGLVAGDIWYDTDTLATAIEGVNIWNGTQWNPYQLLADSLLVPGSVGDIALKDGVITAVKVAANTFTANEMVVGFFDGQTIRGGYIEAPVIASSPNLGQGANALADPNLTGAVNTDWVASGWTGDATIATQTDRIFWDQSKALVAPYTGKTARMRGDVTAILKGVPAPVKPGSVLRSHLNSIFVTTARSIQNPVTYTADINDDVNGWPSSANGEKVWKRVGYSPKATPVSKTTYLTNSADIALVAGETWQVSLNHTGLNANTAKFVTSAKIQVINKATSAVIWERTLVQGELAAASPIEASFISSVTVTAKFRIMATYTGAGAGLSRMTQPGSFARMDYTPVDQFYNPTWYQDVSNKALHPYTFWGPIYTSTTRSSWIDDGADTATVAERTEMWDRAAADWKITSARLSKVTPEKGYRIDNDNGFQLFDSNGAQTGQLDGESNFLAGTFATSDSGERVQMDTQRIAWFDSFGTLISQFDGTNAALATRSGLTSQRGLGKAEGQKFFATDTDLEWVWKNGFWYLVPGQIIVSTNSAVNVTGAAGTRVGAQLTTPTLEIGQRLKVMSNYSQYCTTVGASFTVLQIKSGFTPVSYSAYELRVGARGYSSAASGVHSTVTPTGIFTTTEWGPTTAALYLASATTGVYGGDGILTWIESA